MEWIKKLRQPKETVRRFFSWCILGVIIGVLGGLLGAGFHHILHFVTHLRQENTWLIFLLPVGGLLTVGLYRILQLQNIKGTNEIIDATLDGHSISPLVAPGISWPLPLPICSAVLPAVRAQHCSWAARSHLC